MSAAEVCLWSALRAVTVALLVLPLAWQIAARLQTSSLRVRRWLLVGLVLPVLMPELLIGFVYSETTLRLVRQLSDPTAVLALPTAPRVPATDARPLNLADVLTEALYAAILLLRLVPVASVLLWLVPGPGLSPEAIHCRRLLLRQEPSLAARAAGHLGLFARGPLRATVPAFGVCALLAFQEFEIASLMQISRHPVAWTVWLFDNHAGGLILSESLRLLRLPALLELALLLATAATLLGSSHHQTESPAAVHGRSLVRSGVTLAFVTLSGLMLLGNPLWRLAASLQAGAGNLIRQPGMLQPFLFELLTSLGFGLAAGLAAFWLSGLALSVRRWRVAVLLAVTLPGLLGSLVLSLLLLAAFQTSRLNPLYDTPLPLLLTQTLYLLPRAILLRLIVGGNGRQESAAVAGYLARSADRSRRRHGRAILWHLRARPAVWVVVMLSYWGYWDLTAAAILRPTQLEPFTPGLYNLMHYGRNETLAAMALLAGIFPVCVIGLTSLLQRVARKVL